MTDDEKLELLNEIVTDYWFTIHRVWNDDDWSADAIDKLLHSIERCQRIRLRLEPKKPFNTYTIYDGSQTHPVN